MAHIGNAPFGKTIRNITSETLTSVKTAFYPTGGYTADYLDVFVNGVRQTNGVDFTATNGVLVTLQYSPTIGDTVDIISYSLVEMVNAVKRDGDTLVGTLNTQALVPTANITYDIGTSTMRYRDIYLSGNTINLGDIKLSTNGTVFSVANTTGGTFPSALANTTITGTANISSTLGVAGALSAGNTTVTGTLTSNATTITGNVSITGTQFVNGSVTFANSTANVVSVLTTGSVLINTTNAFSSGRSLQVNGQIAAGQANAYVVVELDADPNANIGYIGTRSNTAVGIKVSDSLKLYVGTNGYIGIGNNTPGVKMHVAGSVALDNDHAIRTGPAADWMIGSSNVEISIGSQAPGGGRKIGLYSFSNSTPAIYCTASGTVGIRTSSPSYTLDVTGDLRVTGDFITSAYGIRNLTGASTISPDSCLPVSGASFGSFLTNGSNGSVSITGTDGHILGMTWTNASVYGAQLYIDTDPTNYASIRTRSGTGVWQSWRTF